MQASPAFYDLLLRRFRATGALVENGHFVYRSGKHGDAYVDHWRLLQDAKAMHHFSQLLAEKFTDPEDKIEVVAGLERGGSHVAARVAYHLSLMMGTNIPWIPVAKREHGTMHYIDDRFIPDVLGKRVLLADDVLNTGSGISQAIGILRHSEIGAHPIAIAALVNRGGVNASFFHNIQKLRVLFSLPLQSWEPSECPMCREEIPISTILGHGRRTQARTRVEARPMLPEEMLECVDYEDE